MTPDRKAAILKEIASDLGFHRVAIAEVRPAATGEAYLAWLRRGDQAEMAYLEERREARLDPSLLFPWARSAVCVALDYRPEPVDGMWEGVARYARGRDYHNVIGKRLRRLASRVREAFPGCSTRAYVDTGPVLERDLASAAGLGVAGKNTMLLHPEAGSYFLLGELFTSLELTADSPIADLCGSCTLCLEACPTEALPQPYRLDSRRCISYWTIEHRGAIPRDLRPEIGGWLFGCDLCQEACPHNDSLSALGDPAFELDPVRRELDLPAVLGLDEPTYQELFRGSPMKRARREGLRRNAAVVMGNSGDRRFVTPLVAALLDGDPVVRGHAAWALGELGGLEARDGLEAARERELDPSVRRELESALEAGESDSETSPVRH